MISFIERLNSTTCILSFVKLIQLEFLYDVLFIQKVFPLLQCSRKDASMSDLSDVKFECLTQRNYMQVILACLAGIQKLAEK